LAGYNFEARLATVVTRPAVEAVAFVQIIIFVVTLFVVNDNDFSENILQLRVVGFVAPFQKFGIRDWFY
jgi:hypothetical protein